MRKQTHHMVILDDDSSDDEPLIAVRGKTARGKGLFVESHRPLVPTSSLFSGSHSRQPPAARKVPFQQSSSEEESSSDEQILSDSLVSQLQKEKNAQREMDRSAAKSLIDNSILQPKRLKTTGVSTVPKTTVANRAIKATSLDTAPKTTGVSTAPKTTSVNTTSKTTGVSTAPKTTSASTATKATGVVPASKNSSASTVSKTTVANSASKTAGGDTAPKATGVETTSRTSDVNLGSAPRTRESKAVEKEAEAPRSPVREKSRQRLTMSAVSTKSPAQHDATSGSSKAKESSEVITSTTSKPTTMRAIRTAPQKQTSRAINFIDQPKEQQKKTWSTENHYSKIKFRGIAEKRSRAEGPPDFSVLDFVHGPPPTLPKAAVSRSNDDPYGRREVSNRRVQEDDPDDRPRRGLGHDPAPLADWEVDKAPLMCADWYLSSNCRYGAQKCLFMHREQDPQGRPYPVGDIYGRVPPKYRKPPITCSFWYSEDGCRRSAEECQYAHKNTGWAEISGKPIRMEHLPATSAGTTPRDLPPSVASTSIQEPPITCPFWLWGEDGCNKTEDECKFVHQNTGWSFPDINSISKPIIQIDSNLVPNRVQPKFAKPPVTCPYWFNGKSGCDKTDEECRFAHKNTGWLPSAVSGDDLPVQTDPRALPRFQRPKSDKGITCASWLRDPNGCNKTEAECKYSHHNTGWVLPKDNRSEQPTKTDPNQIPRSHRDKMNIISQPPEPRLVAPLSPGRRLRSEEITCRFWLRNANGCSKSEQACKFAHRNTGWLTTWLPEARVTGKPERIDLNEGPLSRKLGTYTAPEQKIYDEKESYGYNYDCGRITKSPICSRSYPELYYNSTDTNHRFCRNYWYAQWS